MRPILLVILALVMLSTASAATFTFLPDPDGTRFLVEQNDNFTYDFNVSISEALVVYSIEESNYSNVTIDRDTGVLTLVAANSDVGDDETIVVIAKNRTNNLDAASISIGFNITNVNDAPSISASAPPSPIDAVENDTIALNLTASDPDAPYGEFLNATWIVEEYNQTYVETASIDPTGGTGTLSYTIGFCEAGVLNITGVAEDDEGLNDTVSWTVNVENVNRNVTFNGTILNQTFAEGTGIVANFTYDERFIDPDDLICGDDALTFALENATETTLSVNTTTGAVTFNATPQWSGNETVTITATDANGSTVSSNTFAIEVTPVDDDPIAFPPVPQAQVGYNGVELEIYVRFEDPDLPFGDNLTFTLNDSVMNTGTLSVSQYNVSGNTSYALITGTPQLADVGSTYAYRINGTDDTGRIATTTFTIEVFDNTAPVINDTPITLPDATQDAPYEVLLNGTDDDSDPIAWFVDIITSPGNGTLSGTSFGPFNNTVGAYQLTSVSDSQGNLSFTPTNDDVGNYTIVIIALDSKGAAVNTTSPLTVVNANDPPENLQPDGDTFKAKTGKETLFTVTVDDPDFDIPNPTENVTVIHNGTGIGITITREVSDGSEWQLNWSNPAATGNYTIELTADDGEAPPITTTFTIEVLDPQPPTILAISNLTAQATTPYFNRIEATDPNGDAITFTIDNPIWDDYAVSSGASAFVINTTYNASQLPGSPYTINITASDEDGNTSVVVNFTIEPFNLPPNLSDARDISFVVDNTTTYNFTVEDAENDPWNVFFENPIDWITITNLSNTTFEISGTPNQSHVGFQQANLTVNQTSPVTRTTTYVFNISVFTNPQEPEISDRDPTSDPDSETEGGSRTFSFTVDDPNFYTNESDELTVTWTFDDDFVKEDAAISSRTDVSFDFEYDYCSAPGGTLEATVTDRSNLSVSTSWPITIANQNRQPYFGQRRFTNTEVLTWTETNASIISGGFEQDSASTTGIVESAIFDLGNGKIRDRGELYNVTIGGNGVVYYQVRFRSGETTLQDMQTVNWSQPVLVGETPVNVSMAEYGQLRFLLNSTDPANLSRLENATMHFGIANETINSSTTFLLFYYLDDFFTDPDFEECADENLTVTYGAYPGEAALAIDVQLDETSRTIDIITDTSFDYTDYPYFTFTDSSGANVSSNYYGISVVERPDQVNVPQPTAGGGGGSSTTTITEPVEVPEPEPEPLDIITPGSVSMYYNETLSIPISIVNRWNESLEDITITAESENENTSLGLGIERIQSLAAGGNVTFNLTVTSYATYGEYTIRVNASVLDPEYNGSATILVSSIELGQEGNETFNTKLTFARDLVESNPRCLELNEQIERARDLVSSGENNQAVILLDDIVENCRYLLSLGDSAIPETDTPGIIDRLISETSTESKVYAAVIMIVHLMLLGLVGVYVFRNRKKP